MNDVLLAPQERMTMQTAVDGATLLQQQAEWHLVDTAAPCHEDSCTPERTTCMLYAQEHYIGQETILLETISQDLLMA